MKILFLAANPESTKPLKLAKEAQEIQDAIDSSELSSQFQLIQKWEVRPKDFRRALLRYQPDIVHFSGHGTGKTGLIISDDAGASKEVSGDALAGLFAAFPMVKCVLLNACYAEVQAKAIVGHVDYVIGMKDTIYDQAAIAFSIGFYDSLGYGSNIEAAFALGSNAILWEYDNNTGQTREEPRKMIPVDAVLSQLPEHLKPILLTRDSLVIPEISISPEPRKPDGKVIFLERVKKYMSYRRLTPIAKFQLHNFAKEQGLSETEANGILEAEIGKIEQAKQKYQELLEATIGAGLNPLEPETQQELTSLQQYLKLTDGEVTKISELVLSAGESTKQANATNQKFSFEVITVDHTGKENSRETREAEFYRENLVNNIWLDMVKIPGGKFRMGSPEGEGNSYEKPQHQVTVPAFWLGKYPITQAQWQAIMGNNPSHFRDHQNNPVESVSWDDAQQFCQQLTQKTGNKYRLPTEAEWEYACRAGTSTPFYFGSKLTPQLAICNDGQTGEVGQFYPNAFGLYDMHGQVWEWCADDWQQNYNGAPADGTAWLSNTGNTKVIRGGSWLYSPGFCRSAYRHLYDRDLRDIFIGFRVVCVVPRTT